MSSIHSPPEFGSRSEARLAPQGAGWSFLGAKNIEPRTPVALATLWRGFPAPFEREYRRDRAIYLAPVSRTMVVFSVLLYAGFLLWDALTVQRLVHPLVYVMVFGVIAPSSIISAFLTYRRNANRRFRLRYITIIGLAGNSLALTVLTTYAPTQGIPWPYEWLLINILYALFLVGFVVRISLPAVSIVVLAVCGGNAWFGLEATALIQQTFFLVVTLLVAGVAAMLHERMDRDVWVRRRQLREQVLRDPLTGLYNHRYVFDHGTMLLRQAQREGHHLAALLIDADYFKRLNDSAGHQAGDQALREVAAILEAEAHRPFDIAGRIGGEEFVLLLYGCVQASVEELAETLREKIEQRRISHPAAPGGILTVSVGAATTAHRGESFEQLLARADKALYQAKADGRNCVRVL